MASTIDPYSGFCPKTKIFHSLRPAIPLPHETQPLSLTSFTFSFLPSPLPTTIIPPAFISSSTGLSISYPQLLSQLQNLSSSLRSHFNLSKGDVAFIISPSHIHIPLLYFSLLSIGVVISPSNPASTPSDILSQFKLCHPVIAFATSSTAHKLPANIPTVLLDSTFFHSFLTTTTTTTTHSCMQEDTILQSDTAAILYSSGTTGDVKGVVLTHRNFIAQVAAVRGMQRKGGVQVQVQFLTVPLFHVYGALFSIKAVAVGETAVIMDERFEVGRMMDVVERLRVTRITMAPPALLAMVRGWDGDAERLTCLEGVSCGGAPMGVELIREFLTKFPKVRLSQGYGLTETTSGIFRSIDTEGIQGFGSTGRLGHGFEAKIVDPVNGIALNPCEPGELWVRGPTIMKGYVGMKEVTSTTLDSEGWLKTGDLCYFDGDGFLFVVDRLKELIKYKGYQVAPAELEHLLQKHSDVVEASVIPYPEEQAGEVPMAFIVRQSNSTLGEAEILEFVAKQVAPYKRVRRVSFVNSLPKNAAGKILRKDLIRLATSKPNPKL